MPGDTGETTVPPPGPDQDNLSGPVRAQVEDAIELLLRDFSLSAAPRVGFPSDAQDQDRYQFWPMRMAIGSLTGNHFMQTFGAQCVIGRDDKSSSPRSTLSFDFKRELLFIRSTFQTDAPIPPAFSPLEAELSFSDITSHGIHIHEHLQPASGPGRRSKKTVVVTVCCRRPPRFYTDFAEDYPRSASAREPKKRRATVMDFTTSPKRDAGYISSVPGDVTTNPTFWNAYRWTFSLDERNVRLFHACAQKLRMLDSVNPDPGSALMSRRSDYYTRDHLLVHEWKAPNLEGLDFNTRALTEGLIGHGILRPIDTPELISALKKSAIAVPFRHRILESLFTEGRIRNPAATVQGRAVFLRKTTAAVSRVTHLVKIRTVQVTPTRLLVCPTQPEASNSVTRRYLDRIDAILRVQFRDENGQPLFIHDLARRADEVRPDVGVLARVRQALTHGIVIGGQRYLPVASSSSQQKDHSMWFIDRGTIDGTELRNWMGRVTETVVAKHAARMGLPFSTTREVKLELVRRPDLPDVERNGFCFTDGCAVAGEEVLRKAGEALGVANGAVPSAIQFRLGGAKGVLSHWPNLAVKNEIRLRPSQVKFSSQLNNLNVIRCARYQCGFLNRQFILIMTSNGIPENLFLDLFRQSVRQVDGLRNRVAAGRPTKEDLVSIHGFVEFPLTRIIKAGFYDNPLVLDLCRLIECRILHDLKWRARIRLDNSVFLIGIADESDTLEANEVFCQYQSPEMGHPKVVVAEALVCRAPALHPGDVRRVQAVDNPHLRHLKNVIVFSTKGRRALPNKLGGGDLDGDDFTLIWDQRFVTPLIMYPPMDYQAPLPLTVAKVEQADLNEYMLNDVLGRVDNAHLAQADRGSPFSEVCLRLSNTHSVREPGWYPYYIQLTQYRLPGVAARLEYGDVPKEWPDYMGKDDNRTYRSGKVLGKIFRMIDPEPTFLPTDLNTHIYSPDGRLNAYAIVPSLLIALKNIKADYENAMHYSMRRYQVREAELVAGSAVRSKQRQSSRELSHLTEPLRDTHMARVSETRDATRQLVHELELPPNLSPMQWAARHAYYLTYSHGQVIQWGDEVRRGTWGHFADDLDEFEDLHLRPPTMMSFAWVFWQELLEIARDHRERTSSDRRTST